MTPQAAKTSSRSSSSTGKGSPRAAAYSRTAVFFASLRFSPSMLTATIFSPRAV
jgi:hypothetical protein